jgi:hypothetical protein
MRRSVGNRWNAFGNVGTESAGTSPLDPQPHFYRLVEAQEAAQAKGHGPTIMRRDKIKVQKTRSLHLAR